MTCRPGCGACCVEISISSPIPGMPYGKPAGVRCVHLSDNGFCAIHDTPEYPPVCAGLTPSREMCGSSSEEAAAWLKKLEELTAPE